MRSLLPDHADLLPLVLERTGGNPLLVTALLEQLGDTEDAGAALGTEVPERVTTLACLDRRTAEDAADQGFSTYAIWDLCRPVDPASDSRVRAHLGARGVHIVEFEDVARAFDLTDRDQPPSARGSLA